MDEIIIDEKKYVSSKRAAKITGYAKDYIGQLCREGRVPARLVGRSWYVLETAIQDHRFGGNSEAGAENNEELEVLQKGSFVKEAISDFPRYKDDQVETISVLHKLPDSDIPEDKDTSTDDDLSKRLQDSWKAWFDHIGDMGNTTKDAGKEDVELVLEPAMQTEQEENGEEVYSSEQEIDIPIKTIYRPLPKELLPRMIKKVKKQQLSEESDENRDEEEMEYSQKEKVGAGTMFVVQIVGVVCAVIFAAVATINTGYFDKYLISVSQASVITGITTYNK